MFGLPSRCLIAVSTPSASPSSGPATPGPSRAARRRRRRCCRARARRPALVGDPAQVVGLADALDELVGEALVLARVGAVRGGVERLVVRLSGSSFGIDASSSARRPGSAGSARDLLADLGRVAREGDEARGGPGGVAELPGRDGGDEVADVADGEQPDEHLAREVFERRAGPGRRRPGTSRTSRRRRARRRDVVEAGVVGGGSSSSPSTRPSPPCGVERVGPGFDRGRRRARRAEWQARVQPALDSSGVVVPSPSLSARAGRCPARPLRRRARRRHRCRRSSGRCRAGLLTVGQAVAVAVGVARFVPSPRSSSSGTPSPSLSVPPPAACRRRGPRRRRRRLSRPRSGPGSGSRRRSRLRDRADDHR